MIKKESKQTIAQQLEQLDTIVRWFDEQDQVDVEQGLEKVRQGAELVKELRSRLKTVENEFQELKKIWRLTRRSVVEYEYE